MDFQLVITKMDDVSVKELMQLLPTEEINILKKPETGLLMMAAKDSFDTDFYLGEMLVTETEVEYKGLKGYAMVMGDEPERALLAASVDAILQADTLDEMEDLKQKIKSFLAEQMKRINALQERERQLIAKTKVNFETMSNG
jgi:alpha-D-ribose 1-methylphosphonate 5-triphosphate synthase subunit PhnG